MPSDTPNALDEAFWRLPTILERTGLSESQIARKEQDGTFPLRRRIGARAVAWLASEVIQWMRTTPMAQDVASANVPPKSSGRPRRAA